MSMQKRQFANPAATLWSRLVPGAPRPTRAPSSADLSEPLSERIGKYEVLSRLGGGAMGIVYKCSQPGLERPVAVKIMIAGRHASVEQILRFQRGENGVSPPCRPRHPEPMKNDRVAAMLAVAVPGDEADSTVVL
jgi:hypothetical protein